MASASRAHGLPKFSPRVDGVSIGPGEFALALNGGLSFHPANHTKYKMDIFKNFTSDATLEVEGRWVHISRDAEVLVARSGNDRFAKKMKALVQKNNLDLSDESEENVKLLEELIIEAMAQAYISTNLANSIVFAVLIVVLLVKPAGLLGKYVPEKV